MAVAVLAAAEGSVAVVQGGDNLHFMPYKI